MSPVTISRLSALALTSFILQSAPTPTERADSIEQVATMRIGRSVHTATTLRSGEVLVVGGMTTGWASLAGVELFDPATNRVEELPSLAEPRASHTATLLGDGRVLIAGGYHGEYMQSVEIFDPARKAFRGAGPLTEARSGHTATLLPDGRVLIIGGVGRGWTFLRTAELYDPATGRSEAVGSMAVPRESHTATLLADGRVLVIGGHNGRRSEMEVYGSAEVFNAATRRFEPAGTLRTARHKHDAVRMADGRVLVVGGADRTDRNYFRTTEIFDPGTAAFTDGPAMSNARYKIATTTVLLPGGDVLVTSGARVAERLDRESGVFREVPGSLPEAFRFAAAAPLANGDVFFAGGYSDTNRSTTGVWRFRRP